MGRAFHFFKLKAMPFRVLMRVGHILKVTKELVEESNRRCNREISYQTAILHRLAWRKSQGIVHDARTHEDIPRRNMLRDDKWTHAAWKAMLKAAHGHVKSGEVLEWVTELMGEFHSIDQLREMLTELLEVTQRKAA